MIAAIVLILLSLFLTFMSPLRRLSAASRPEPKHEAPALAADEVEFRPSDKVYAREPQVVQGKRSAPEFDFVATSWQTVAEAAQVYADFSKKEVRVPRALLERKLSFGHGTGKAAFGYIVQGLDSQLHYDGVDVVPLGRGVLAFRVGKNFAEQVAEKAAAVKEATPAEVAAARAAMTDERFWSLIETARRVGGGDCFKTADTLQRTLRGLTAGEILGFSLRFQERMQKSYRWDLWGVAYLVNGGASDDGFEYFRAWLIGQGREYFEAALKNPERAADRAGRRQDNECEQLLYCAMEAYESKTQRPLPRVTPPSASTPAGPAGTSWKEEDLPRLFPTVAKKFR